MSRPRFWHRIRFKLLLVSLTLLGIPLAGYLFIQETEQFLRDVIAMANASVDGVRYIVTGAECDDKGRKHFHGVPRDDFSRTPSYQSLANQYVEPPIRIQHQSV